ncbi:MAG TPA: HEAT repeat domain-containing protein [Acidobacteriota bacterium]|nr:HEAT repeat domain-containing protein [Acidobacteriota bacterium]HQO20639.1 HEAT repeat domain-containing protein [Acidobacteriota bacterium]HQQ47475.1 HEAT repeat domain-containing protein [Acidobacteriota bacterium]
MKRKREHEENLVSEIVFFLIVFIFFSISLPNSSAETSSWTEKLRKALDGTTKIVISPIQISLEIDDAKTKTKEKAVEIKDKQTIMMVIDNIVIDDEQSGFYCACLGDTAIKFFRKDKLIANLSFHHGRSLRWNCSHLDADRNCLDDIWPGDGLLINENAELLATWMAQKGIRTPLEDRLRSERLKQTNKTKYERAASCIPESLKEYFSSQGRFAEYFNATIGTKEERMRILFCMLGSSNESWSMLDWIDQEAYKLLEDYGKEYLQNSVLSALKSNDRQTRRGASRFWIGWKSPLQEWEPEDNSLYGTLLTVLQESSLANNRQMALNNLKGASPYLSVEETDKFFFSALHDPDANVRRKAMITAGEMGYVKAIPYLIGVLKGTTVKIVPLPDIPDEERIFPEDDFSGQVGRKLSDKEIAAISLGYLNHADAVPFIKKLEPSPAHDVALALLGEIDLLKEEYFKSQDSNQELQLAAVEAVLRAKGMKGLSWAIDYKLCTHWWEPERVMDKIKKMLLSNNAPGREIIERTAKLKDLRAWYDTYGEKYIEQMKN